MLEIWNNPNLTLEDRFEIITGALSRRDELLTRRAERINSLCSIIAEAYQVIGTLASDCGRFEDPQVIKILDNLSEEHMVHSDVLPFPSIQNKDFPSSEEARSILLKYGPIGGVDMLLDRCKSSLLARHGVTGVKNFQSKASK